MDHTSSLFSVAEMGHQVDKKDYESQLESLRVELLNLQYDLRDADFSVLLLIVGDDRPGCVDVVRKVHEWMDERYIDTHVLFGPASEEERERPVIWRYWQRLPAHGRIGLYLGAWPAFIAQTALDEHWNESALERALDHAERLERALVSNGTLLLKFWVHLPKGVMEKRLSRAEAHPQRSWRFEDRDWELLDRYEDGVKVFERILRKTNTPRAPWTVVESTDSRYRNLTIAEQIAAAVRHRLDSPTRVPSPVLAVSPPVSGRSLLDEIDLSASVPPDEYSTELGELQRRLNELVRLTQDHGVSCVMAFEGPDAAGKGGTIRRVTAAMPIECVKVVRVGAPNDEEKARHYLWRFWRRIPKFGNHVIFDRSWYGRVLVERVEGFAEEGEWSRAYEEINDFESVLDESGFVVLKFWLQIDSEEQLRRFEARAKTPYKKYKLTEDDYRNREKWDAYQQAAHDMVARTSTSYAPWYLVSANDKRHARLMVLRTVCERLEQKLLENGVLKPARKKKKQRKGKA